MAKKIGAKDIFQSEDIFIGIRDSAKQTIKMMQQLKGEVEKTASALSGSMGKSQTLNSTKELEKVVKVSKQANTLKKEAIQIDKLHSQAIQQEARANQELEKIEQQKLKTQSQQMRNDKQMRTEKERLLKIQEKQKKTITDESNAYKRLVKETREAKNESKRLGAELLLLEKAGKKNSKEYRNLAQAYNQMTTSAKKGDKALKTLDKSVGDNFRNVGNYKGAIQGLVSTLGTLGAGVGIGQIFRNVTGIMVDFDQAQADLSAITGQTKGELSGLTAQAKELGKVTQFSATQITEMQIELGKLGFSSQQILDSTKAVSNFAAATGADLASASKVAGSALRAFGMEASEMERVVSVLGVATTKSALSFGDYETAMSQVAPVAQAFGFSIEDTTTLLASLKNAGFDASKGAIATKNILLNLADANGKLAKEIGRPVTSLDDMAQAFGELEAKGIDLAKALDLTDKRSVSAFKVFMQNADGLTDFRDSITNVSAELQDMADKKLDSVGGQVKLLTSAWEGWVLGMDDSTGASKKLKDMIGFLAQNLDTIMNTLVIVLDIWVRYQIIVRASALSTQLFNSAIVKTARKTKGLKGVINGLGGAFKKLGQAIKSNIVGLAMIALFELYQELTRVSGMMEKLDENTTELAEASMKVEQNLKKETKQLDRLFEALRDTNSESKERENLINKINSTYGTTLQNLEDEEAWTKQIDSNYQNILTGLRDKAKLEKTRVMYELSQRQLGEAEIAHANANRAFDALSASRGASGMVLDLISQGLGFDAVTDWATGKSELRDAQLATAQILANTKATAKIYEDDFLAMEADIVTGRITGSVPRGGGAGGGAGTPSSRDLNQSLKDVKEFNTQYFKIQQDRRKTDEKERQRESKDVIDGEIMNAIKRARETGEARVEVVEEMLKKEFEMRKEFKKAELDVELFNERQIMKQERVKTRKDFVDDYEKKLIIARKFDSDMNDINKTKEKELKAQYVTNGNLLRDAFRTESADFKLRSKQRREAQQSDFNTMTDELTQEQDAYNNKINDALGTFAEGTSKASKIASDDAIATAKEQADIINEVISKSADYFIKRSEDKIEQMNKEITEAEKQADHFRTIAENGNIDARESLAEQQRIINEKNKEKLKQEKIQQRIRLTESVLNTYSAKVTQNPETAISETIRDTTLLLSFINSLPAFHDGTENTGENGQGVDGKGGFHAVLHPNERVIPKSMNDKMGSLTNEDLTKLAIDYKNGRVVEKASYSSTSLDLSVLVGELSEIKQTIKNKPETNIELGEITSTMMEMVKTTKKGNSITYNRYKIRK